MTEILQATPIEYPAITLEDHQHIALASEETPGRSWGKRVLQLHTRKFGEGGFEMADLELEAIMLDLDRVIYD